MPQPQLLIIEADDAVPGAFGRIGLRHALERAGLPPSACRVTRLADFLSVKDHSPSVRGFAAWLLIGPETAAIDVDEALETLTHMHVPVALTRQTRGGREAPSPDEAVVGLDARTPLDATAAVLAALARQAQPQARLAAESRLLKRQHEGLSREMSRLDDELRMAMKIQRGFLPAELPAVGPLRVDVLWRPAGYIGGDLYDVTRLDEHHLGFSILDAVGHGVPAALMAIHLKQSLCQRELTPGQGGGYRLLEPGETLRRLNQNLLDLDRGSAALATAVVAVLDTRTGFLKVARAGHPLPLLLRRGEEPTTLGPDGPMLGVFACEEFKQDTVRLRNRDRLLFYSDGFEHAFPHEKAPTGPGRRMRVSSRHLTEFASLAEGPIDEAMDRFRLRLESQTGSLHPPDDLTLLCLAVDGSWAESAANTALAQAA